jgi:hypothetical protein
MSFSRFHFAAPFLLLSACAGDATSPVTAPQAAVGNTIIDVSGSWIVTESEKFLHLSQAAAGMFGLQPEGERTSLRCSATGTLTLQQTGAAFSGSYTESGQCTTAGGQQIVLQGAGDIVEGSVRGRSVHFVSLGAPGPVECPNHASIPEVSDGRALRMQGTFACIEPGHPRSTLPLPGPRMGPNRTMFEAERP